MKLFSPQDANTFVFATVANSAREGTTPDYKCVAGPDVETCLKHYQNMSGACLRPVKFDVIL